MAKYRVIDYETFLPRLVEALRKTWDEAAPRTAEGNILHVRNQHRFRHYRSGSLLVTARNNTPSRENRNTPLKNGLFPKRHTKKVTYTPPSWRAK